MTGRLANVALRDDTDRRAYAAHHFRLHGASCGEGAECARPGDVPPD